MLGLELELNAPGSFMDEMIIIYITSVLLYYLWQEFECTHKNRTCFTELLAEVVPFTLLSWIKIVYLKRSVRFVVRLPPQCSLFQPSLA